MSIVLTSGTMAVSKINRKVSAKLFKDLREGSLVEFSVPLKHAGTRRGRSYSVDVKVIDVRSGNSVNKTFNELANILDAFDFVKVD